METLKKIFIFFIAILLIVFSLSFTNSFYRYRSLEDKFPVEQIRNNLIKENENYVFYKDISKDLINATIAVEDRRFNERYGFDYIAFVRAMLNNLINLSFVQGGSTIEQQFIKIYYFNYENSISRKFAEILFMYDLDNTYTKDEIIEMYLNVINYGDGYFGIFEASQGYFNKKPIELNLHEASLLAGIPNSPANLQLSNNNPDTYKRQKRILKLMYEQKYISEDTYNNLTKNQN